LLNDYYISETERPMFKASLLACLSLGTASFAETAQAGEIPIAPQTAGASNYYTLQLRGVSFGPSGEDVQAFIDDPIPEPATDRGLLLITADAGATVLVNQRFGAYFGSTGTTYIQDFLLPYNTPLHISMEDQAYVAGAALVYGSNVVASAAPGSFTEAPFPTFATDVTITRPNVPEPASAGLMLTAAIGMIWAVRRPKKRAA
jgi:hypothetical protein